ncbi:MAG: RNA-dependent DNA polymerase [bacterium]|nr:RNA-dependent DNA polymerase [bacterium]
MSSEAFLRIISWENLLDAYRKASKNKRGKETTARFEHQIADHLLDLQEALKTRRYRPGPYVNFSIHEPKRRLISAAPFRDRVVHHALCNVIEPWFERRFVHDSYANRVGKGTHLAVDRLQQFARRYRYALRMDVVKHFPSIDHAILRETLARVIKERDVIQLIDLILESGAEELKGEYEMVWFPGDDLFTPIRPRGLPIGNLTSQFWSNCYLDPFDHFVKRELRCPAYLRYVDDFTLFSNSKRELWRWKGAIIKRLSKIRLKIHKRTQVFPVKSGIPWLGFIVYPTHRRLKARKVYNFGRHLQDRWRAYCAGEITFAEFDATVQGWINYARYGDTWGLRRRLLSKPLRRISIGNHTGSVSNR